MIYLVTGCAGFIGSHLTRRLLAEGHKVVGVDIATDRNLYRISDIIGAPGFMYHPCNILNDYKLLEVLAGNYFDAVFHLAAKTGVRDSIEDPSEYLRTNTQGTLNILEYMRRTGCNKIILASTSSVYAGEKTPYTEDMTASRPLSPYAASKRAAELMSYTYHSLYDLDVTVLRYFTVYGPRGRVDMAPYRIVRSVCDGEPFTVYGDGTQLRDWTYVDDIVEGTVRAESLSGWNVLNLGRGKQVSLNGVISMAETAAGRKANIIYQGKATGDMDATLADIERAEVLLGWTPAVSILEGISRTVEWYRGSALKMRAA
jgi:nucleoside-diphosphate-sugar epimerase